MYDSWVGEADRLQKGMKAASAGNIMGYLTIALLVLSIMMKVKQMYDEQKRKQQEYERDVMQTRGYRTRDEFLAWDSEQKQGVMLSRTRNTLR